MGLENCALDFPVPNLQTPSLEDSLKSGGSQALRTHPLQLLVQNQSATGADPPRRAVFSEPSFKLLSSQGILGTDEPQI